LIRTPFPRTSGQTVPDASITELLQIETARCRHLAHRLHHPRWFLGRELPRSNGALHGVVAGRPSVSCDIDALGADPAGIGFPRDRHRIAWAITGPACLQRCAGNRGRQVRPWPEVPIDPQTIYSAPKAWMPPERKVRKLIASRPVSSALLLRAMEVHSHRRSDWLIAHLFTVSSGRRARSRRRN